MRYEKIRGERLPVKYNTAGNNPEETLEAVDQELKEYGLEIVIADVGQSEVFFKVVRKK